MDKIEENNKSMGSVENFLYFNDEDQDQQEQGLKILTLNQILSRLPISLAQLNAGSNSENLLKNQTNMVFFVQIKKFYKKRL